jgi:hypothetical protein
MASRVVVLLLVLFVLLGPLSGEAAAGRLIFLMDRAPLLWTVKAKVSLVPRTSILDISGRVRCHDHGTGLCPAVRRGRAAGTFFLTTTTDGSSEDASLTMYVEFRNGARCVFDGRVASDVGIYSCRDAEGTLVAEDAFSFGTCRCHRGRVCRSSSPCP